MLKTTWKLIHSWGPPLVIMAIIFSLSSRQSIAVSDTHAVNFIVFKSLHIMEYGLLTFLFIRALSLTTKLSFNVIIVLAGILALAYGMSDEIHQTFVPTRQGSIRDLFIDLIGISMTMLAAVQIGQRKLKKLFTLL